MRHLSNRLGSSFLIFCLPFSLFTDTSLASTCTVKSGEERASLVELYTSEGCSSCPRADKWLSQLDQQSNDIEASKRTKLGKQIVPLAFHVDYWNYIGWVDPFSQSRFTSRQREIAHRGKLATIYTPQVVLNGRDYRGWRQHNIPALLKKVRGNLPQSDISLKLNDTGSGRVNLQISATLRNGVNAEDAQLTIALFENNLKNSINAGENSGRVLSHDNVVREISGPYQIPSSQIPSSAGKISINKSFNLKSSWKTDDVGIAVFVQNHLTGEVYQVVSSPLNCKESGELIEAQL